MSQYQGDLYRSNFKYRALSTCGMTLGRSAMCWAFSLMTLLHATTAIIPTTLRSFPLPPDLERWKTQYTKFDGAPTMRTFKVEQKPIRHAASAINPCNAAMEIHLEIPAAGDGAVVEIQLESRYGVAGGAVLVKKL